jgi:hypothetical protein
MQSPRESQLAVPVTAQSRGTDPSKAAAVVSVDAASSAAPSKVLTVFVIEFTSYREMSMVSDHQQRLGSLRK